MSTDNYTISILKNDYSNILLKNSNGEILSSNDPKKYYGYFHGDEISFDNGKVKLISRQLPDNIPGILELFGIYSFSANKRGVPSYLFRPFNKEYPLFICHSTLRRKSKCNQIVTIKLKEWNLDEKIPKGEIVRVLGDINSFTAIEHAMLFRYEVFPKKFKINKNKFNPSFNCIGRKEIQYPIYSIDPEGCTDIDDGFSIETDKLLIHISDVYGFLEENNLLEKIVNISSIYLSNNVVKHALDTILSSNYCSLIKDQKRYMITLEINLNTLEYSFYISYGIISANYSYDNYPKELDSKFSLISALYKEYIGKNKVVSDSHEFIEALMIIYNNLFIRNLKKHTSKQPIFRVQDTSSIPYTKPKNDLEKFINIINSRTARYSLKDDGHFMLNTSNYSHTTSPIRRIVDLINQEIYYGKDTYLFNKFPIHLINTYNNNLKKFYRKNDYLRLVELLENAGEENLDCYIYNLDNFKISLYIKKYKLSIDYKIYTDEISKLHKIELINNDIYIDNIKIWQMNTIINLKIYAKIDINNINKSLKIELF
jgi:exoribonuclease R